MRSTWFKQSEAPKYKIPYVFNGYHTSRYLDEVFVCGARIYCYEMAEQNPSNGDDPKISFYVAHKGIYEDVYDLKCFTEYCCRTNRHSCVFYTDDEVIYNKIMKMYEDNLHTLFKSRLAKKLMK